MSADGLAGVMPAAQDDRALHAELPTDTLDSLLATERERLQLLFPLPPARPARSSRSSRSSRRGAIAASATGVAALLLAALWWADPCWQREELEGLPVQPRSVALRDGSQLTLDARARVAVAWHLRSRRLVLEQGRARFEVAASTWRPLTVAAGAAQVHVVGTAFDIDRQRMLTQVSVLHGRVEVSAAVGEGAQRDAAPTAPLMLTAGQRVQAHWVTAPTDRPEGTGGTPGHAAPAGATDAVRLGDIQTRPAPDPGAPASDDCSAWTEGRLVFRRMPLPQALAEMQRYHPVALRLHGQALARMTVTGSFDTAQAAQVLDLLPRILPVQLSRQPDGSVDLHALQDVARK